MIEKERALRETLSSLGSVVVAYSGGVDSAYLACVAHDTLGDRALAVTADSPSYPERHRQMAVRDRRAVRPAPRDHPDPRARAARVPRQPGQPLLLLQARALHAPRAHRRRARRRRRRRQQRRRPRRLPAGPPGGARVRRAQPARRSRSQQGRNPRAVAPCRPADLGRAGVGLPVVAHSVSLRSDRREAADDRARRAGAARARLPRVPRPAPRRPRARRDRRDELPRALEPRYGRGHRARAARRSATATSTIDLQGYRTGSLNEGLLLRSSVTRLPSARQPAPSPCVFLALHLPFLPSSLEDLDSINFALGIRDFDVARHQPHPPGYPLFIAAARAAACGRGRRSSAASCLLSVISRRARGVRRWPRWSTAMDGRMTVAVVASLVAVTHAALLVHGRAAAERHAGPGGRAGVQALLAVGPTAIARSSSPRRSSPALAAGIRSQVVWLTLPLLVLSSGGGRARPVAARRSAPPAPTSCGALAWAVPLVLADAAARAYWRALASQGAEDLTGVAMLWTTPTLRQLWPRSQQRSSRRGVSRDGRRCLPARAAPGSSCCSGSTAIGAADVVGAVRALPRLRLLFQETVTTRYALPLVVPVPISRSSGCGRSRRPPGASPRGPSACRLGRGADGAAPAREPGGAVRLCGGAGAGVPAARRHDAARAAVRRSAAPVLAMHRRADSTCAGPSSGSVSGLPRSRGACRRRRSTSGWKW